MTNLAYIAAIALLVAATVVTGVLAYLIVLLRELVGHLRELRLAPPLRRPIPPAPASRPVAGQSPWRPYTSQR